MPKLRIAARIFVSAAVLYVAGCLVGGIAVTEVSLKFRRHRTLDVSGYRTRLRQQFGAEYQDAEISADDGARLRAWFVQPPTANGKSVIILHGITANRYDSTGFAEIFLREGYSVLLPDSRAHGDSGGAIATYGILERRDVFRWVAWLRARAPGCTYLLGESMGAAIGLQATAITPQLCAVAVEDPYSTFREIGYERVARITHTSPRFWSTAGRPVLETAYLYARLRYRIYLPDASPQYAVEHSTVPTLLIAGTADQNIPVHHAQQLEAACNSHCTLWIVPGADHGGASSVAHAEFEQRIPEWFRTHDPAQ